MGNRELDTEKVGFKQLDDLKGTYPELVFDAELLGNRNEGHEYAAGTTPIIKTDKNGKAIRKPNGQFDKEYLGPINHNERMALIEYLKSL